METLHRIQKIFRELASVLIALCTSLLIFSFAVWLPNISLIYSILTSQTVSTFEKLTFLTSLYGSITTNFTTLSATYTILIALLSGVYVALLVHVIRTQRQFMGAPSMAGMGGLLGGFFGIGCAACGTVVLTSLATVFGAGAFISTMPLGGQEFGVAGVMLLLIAIRAIAQKTDGRNTCITIS
jgi:hypothetical protein